MYKILVRAIVWMSWVIGRYCVQCRCTVVTHLLRRVSVLICQVCLAVRIPKFSMMLLGAVMELCHTHMGCSVWSTRAVGYRIWTPMRAYASTAAVVGQVSAWGCAVHRSLERVYCCTECCGHKLDHPLSHLLISVPGRRKLEVTRLLGYTGV